MREELLEAEAVEEEDEGAPAVSAAPARREPSELAAWKGEARTVAIAAAGGIVAGAATVAAVKAVSRGASKRSRGRLLRRERPREVIASRSFLVDVHLLGK